MIKIRVNRNLGKGAPGERLGDFIGKDFKAGDLVDIGFIPEESGYPRAPITTADELSFWTNADIDYGLIFKVDEISEIVATANDKHLAFIRRAWPNAPITILP